MTLNILLGCDYLLDDGHINKDVGILVGFPVRQLLSGNIQPYFNNTKCNDRRTSRCNVNCHHAVTVYQSGHGWSPQNKGKRL